MLFENYIHNKVNYEMYVCIHCTESAPMTSGLTNFAS